MISLICAILSSFLVSFMMRLGEAKGSSKMGLLVSNYSVCSLLGLFFLLSGPKLHAAFAFPIGLGLSGGFLFLFSLLVFQKSIAANGVVLSSTFMKLGVLIPTLLSMLLFREMPSVFQAAGFLLALFAIVYLNASPNREKAAGKGLLLLLLFVCGFTDMLTNVYDKLGHADGKNLFLFTIFFTALIFSLILLARGKQKPSSADLLCGILVGIPNYFSSRFLLASLKTLPAVIVFPVFSVGTILLVTVFGVLFFHERLNRRKMISLFLILAALVLLNV